MPLSLVPIKASRPIANTSALKAAISTGMSQVAQDIRDDMQQNTDSWLHPPKWVVVTAGNRRDILTTDAIYRYQDKGTKAHVIMPKAARRLVFQVPSVGTVFATRVNHPGNKAQDWTVKVAQNWQSKVGPIMQTYIDGVL